MGLGERLSLILRSNVNDLVDRAEDPEKTVKQLIIDMNNQLLEVKTQVAASIADEKLLYDKYQSNLHDADEWQHKAEFAVEKGQDDLARSALQRHNSFQSTADGFKGQYDQQNAQVEQLRQALNQLEAKILDATTKESLLIARARRAKTEVQIRTTLSGLNNSGAVASFDRIEAKVQLQEAKAAALGELDSGGDTDHRFQLLEQDDAVARQLAELKAKKGLAAPAQDALPAGSTSQ